MGKNYLCLMSVTTFKHGVIFMPSKKPPTGRKHSQTPRAGQHVIFRPWKTHPVTKEVMWAKDYGLKAWCIWVGDDDPPKNQGVK
jgi:hypothetical protein